MEDTKAKELSTGNNPTAVEGKMPSPLHEKSSIKDIDSGTVQDETVSKQDASIRTDPSSHSTAEPVQETEPEPSSCNWRVPPKKRVDVQMEADGESVPKDAEAVAKPSKTSNIPATDTEMMTPQKAPVCKVPQEKSSEDENGPEGESISKQLTIEGARSKECVTSNGKSSYIHQLSSENNKVHQPKSSKPNRMRKLNTSGSHLKRHQKYTKPFVCHICHTVVWGRFSRFRLHNQLHLKYHFRGRKQTNKSKSLQKTPPRMSNKIGIPKRKSKRQASKAVAKQKLKLSEQSSCKVKTGARRQRNSPTVPTKSTTSKTDENSDIVSIPIPKEPSSLYLCAKCCVGFSDVMDLVAHVQGCTGPPKKQSVGKPRSKSTKKTTQTLSKTVPRTSRQPRQPSRKTVIVTTEDRKKIASDKNLPSTSSRRRKPRVVVDYANKESESEKENDSDADWLPSEPEPEKPPVKEEPDEFVCTECGSAFKYKAALKRHWQTHQIVTALNQCQFCIKTFQDSSQLDSHLVSDHAGELVTEETKIQAKSREKKPRKIADSKKKATKRSSRRKSNPASKAKRSAKVKSNPDNECPICRKRFSFHSAMVRHKALHAGDRRHHCSICSRKFTQSCHLKTHILRVHRLEGTDEYKCALCEETFTFADDLKSHLNQHEQGAPHECVICKKAFVDDAALDWHVQRKHLTKSRFANGFKCDECGKKFSFASSLTRHKYTHTGIKMHKCGKCSKQFLQKCHFTSHKCGSGASKLCMVCGKSFSSAASMKNHELSVHKGTKDFKCPTCKKGFATSGHLKVHVNGAHGAGNHLCPQCGKSFSFHSSYLRHLKFHTGAKPYKCTFCERTFTQSSHCKAHETTHTQMERLRCEFCGKRFKNQRNYKNHIKIHHSLKSFKCYRCFEEFKNKDDLACHMDEKCNHEVPNTVCKECNKNFPTNSHLVRHMRIHTNERPFACTICDKAFTQNSHLKNHVMRHNKIKPWQCEVCGRSYASREYLKHHVKKIHEDDPDGQALLKSKRTKRTDCEICGKVYKNTKYLKVHMKRKHSGVLVKQLLSGGPSATTATVNVKKDPTEASTEVQCAAAGIAQETLQNLVVYPTVTVSGENTNRLQVPVELHTLPQTTVGIPLQQQAAPLSGPSVQMQMPPEMQNKDQHPTQRKPEEAGPNMIAESMRLITVMNWW